MRTVTIGAALVASAAVGFAQGPPGPAPTGLVVGSGNFFSPITANLDKTVAFYRDGLGLDVQGAPANADANPPDNLFLVLLHAAAPAAPRNP